MKKINNITNKLYQIPSEQLASIKGGTQQMSAGYLNGSPSTGVQNRYDTADKTPDTRGGSTIWDNVAWYDMCGNPVGITPK